eukprot:40789-Eustigmatos_ZCMA.PRE.1
MHLSGHRAPRQKTSYRRCLTVPQFTKDCTRAGPGATPACPWQRSRKRDCAAAGSNQRNLQVVLAGLWAADGGEAGMWWPTLRGGVGSSASR